MRILVYPHDLGLGGSQLNAIEIGAGVRDLGHDVLIYGRPGSLVSRIRELGLEFVESPPPHRRPSINVVRALRKTIQTRAIDIVHGYEWPPSLESLLAVRGLGEVTAVSTVMSMAVAPFLPRYMPLAVGTEEIAAEEKQFGRANVCLLEPPVDLSQNSPDLDVGQEQFRREWEIDPAAFTVVAVSRLAHELKLEGLLAAMDAVAIVSRTLPVSLMIVGDGPARDEVAAKAARVNAQAERNIVVLTGELKDPRPAYAIADVAIGMGGSALRALAFGKPLVVQGENGFWELLTPSSLAQFLWRGWYGIGAGRAEGADKLACILCDVLADEKLKLELGRFGFGVVQGRFSLQRAASNQVAIYESARDTKRRSTVEDARAVGRFLEYESRRGWQKVLGRLRNDDFNSRSAAIASLNSTSAAQDRARA